MQIFSKQIIVLFDIVLLFIINIVSIIYLVMEI